MQNAPVTLSVTAGRAGRTIADDRRVYDFTVAITNTSSDDKTFDRLALRVSYRTRANFCGAVDVPPDQDPQKIGDLFEEYVRKICPKTVELKITRMHGGRPWMAEFDNKYVRAAGRAIEQGFGKTPVFNREGGSIPVVATFQQELGIPSVLFGVGLPDDNLHAPNEKLDLGNFHNGIIASAFLYQEIADTVGG